ncbi:MAG: DUF2760 domain-containing protein [Chloroflexota bacterium]|nr:DUF2760 domain-containing protein [Chloroflexota bacterium]
MREKQALTVQTLLLTLLLNAILLGVVYYLAGGVWNNQWITIVGIGLGITLLLGGMLSLVGRRQIESAAASATATEAARMRETRPRDTTPITASVMSRPAAPAKPVEAPPPSHAPAVQMLAILQRQGRLIDFLQEDLALYEDAQIGAAVRSIHEGCKQALGEHVQLEPVFSEPEGSTVTVQPGFDTQAVRLIGDVTGNPPFRGELRHRGWRVAKINLPERMNQDKAMIVAAAEVEVGG